MIQISNNVCSFPKLLLDSVLAVLLEQYSFGMLSLVLHILFDAVLIVV
jgi:hypothetical protein